MNKRLLLLAFTIALSMTLSSCTATRKGPTDMNIAQVMIFVDDLELAKKFYIDTFGLRLKSDLSSELGMIIVDNDSCILTIHGGFEKVAFHEGRKIAIAFGVKDIHSKVAELKDKGVTFIGDIEETPVHWFQAFLDPSGNIVEIGQYK